jgi:serine/threonine-protein kinase
MENLPLVQKTFVTPGAVIDGKYRVERRIGQGGMAYIVAARHLQLDEIVALKFLVTPEGREEEFRVRFLREAQVTAKLRSPHVVRTLDFGVTEEGSPFIVMEYLEGITLRQLLRDVGPLPIDVAVGYAVQTCEGLAEAHRHGVVHRDLKPANLFLTKDLGGGDLVKILDFGVSKLRNFAAAQSDLTAAGTLLGSPRYMAVEQIVRAGDVDTRADIWSLGTILYEMLVGHPCFAGNNTATVCAAIINGVSQMPMREARPEIPEELERVVLRCLHRDLDERTPDVAILATELVSATGLEELIGGAKAVEDVLQASSLSRTGRVRAFGQTGSHPSASGSHRPAANRDSGSVPRPSEESAASEVGARSRHPRRALVAVASVLAVGGAVAVLFSRAGQEEAVVATAEVPPSAQPREAEPATKSADERDAEVIALDGGVTDARREDEASSPRSRSQVPSRHRPPPDGAAVPAVSPPPPAAPTTLDPFGSRY